MFELMIGSTVILFLIWLVQGMILFRSVGGSLRRIAMSLEVLANAERIRSKLDGTLDPRERLPESMEYVNVAKKG